MYTCHINHIHSFLFLSLEYQFWYGTKVLYRDCGNLFNTYRKGSTLRPRKGLNKVSQDWRRKTKKWWTCRLSWQRPGNRLHVIRRPCFRPCSRCTWKTTRVNKIKNMEVWAYYIVTTVKITGFHKFRVFCILTVRYTITVSQTVFHTVKSHTVTVFRTMTVIHIHPVTVSNSHSPTKLQSFTLSQSSTLLQSCTQ